MKIELLPAAEADLAEAAAFYERTGSAVVAAKFIAEFKRIANVLVQFPGIGSPRSRGRRGFPMSLFPYTVIYRQTKDGITILVVKHDRRATKLRSRARVSCSQLRGRHIAGPSRLSQRLVSGSTC